MKNDTTLVILGATGDLTSRLLLPALAQLLERQPNLTIRLVGVGVEDWDDATWATLVQRTFTENSGTGCLASLTTIEYRKADITKSTDMKKLLGELTGRIALYFAVPPAIAAASCAALKRIKLPPNIVLALEKPFGVDERRARELNELLATLLPENHIFRVDHFLGRTTLLNMLGVRFTNRVFEPLWNAEHVSHVSISYDEALGLEGRSGYYDHSGALEDMIQSHLLQVLAFVAMEPPATLDERDLRDATGAALRATRVWHDDAASFSHRARYTAGTIDDRQLPSYVDEEGVDPKRETETLAEVTFEVATARWAGVPFTLRSGKALSEPRREVVMNFKPVRHVPGGFTGTAKGAVLRISLNPDVMSLEINVNGGEDPFALHRVTFDTDLGEGDFKAYAEVLAEILEGDAALSVRGDAAEECWRIIAPVQEAWARGSVPLQEYPAGAKDTIAWPAS
ncbi:glucose-6-phosphate dehydrogenase [Microbacterium gorillae]|uniref:glucose-6-phosphate dehydrogenase n=1 Tax=Microbacterium gorillae TaxID=1231063 RepID=UPI00058D7721|nr:glucose-6-phosphate dehydrogenase [Microbacterium gorillae]